MKRLIIPFYLTLVMLTPNIVNAETDHYITITDETGSVIMQTGLSVTPGDIYIAEDNRVYEITFVENDYAKCRYQRNESLSLESLLIIPVQAAQNTNNLIALYHTHTDESYIPTDGKPAVSGGGGILSVGEALSERLKANGYQTIHDTTVHEPHDANAYQRSRRTFMKLLKEQPLALFDIHRDSAPLNIYSATINGEDVSKILLVVGKQNQNRNSTLDFAKQAKAAADSKYTGLIRGIFIAQGNYNEDLSPKALLLEIGTQYNTRKQAEKSAALFADVVPLFLAVSKTEPPAAVPQSLAEDMQPIETPVNTFAYDIAAIILVLLVGSFVYLYASTGSLQELKAKLLHLRVREFRDLFTRLKRK